MPGDASFSNVSLLLHLDGADGATTTTDVSPSPKTPTFFSGAALSTAKSRFGSSSLSGASGASGARVSFLSSDDFNMGTGDFTVECWVYVENYAPSGNVTHFVQRRSTTGPWTFYLALTTDNKPEFSIYNTGGTRFKATGPALLPTNQWVALRGVRDGSNIKMFVDGLLVATTAVSGAAYGSTEPLILIGTSDGDSRFRLDGYIDEVRITKGVARSTSSYTPDTAPFPGAFSYDLVGTVRDAADAPAARKVVAYREDTSALVGTTTSDGTTGAYSLTSPVGTSHTLVFYPADGESLNTLTLRGVVPVEA